jgi:hypothetical protein
MFSNSHASTPLWLFEAEGWRGMRHVILLKCVLEVTTEYTELQPLLSGLHSVMRVKLALACEGGGCTPTPSYYIYHHQ